MDNISEEKRKFLKISNLHQDGIVVERRNIRKSEK
jgi:hypothetical protein